MAYDEEDGEVLDIDAAAGLDDSKEDEMDGFHDVDPVTGAPVAAVSDDDADDDEDDLDEEELEGDMI